MKNLSELLATNVRLQMEARGIRTQMELVGLTHVPQKTISSVLSPSTRPPSKNGKIPSLTLATLEKLADGLRVPAWTLLRPVGAQNDEVFGGVVATPTPLRKRAPSLV